MQYECNQCGMSVQALKCGKCGSDLKNKTIKNQSQKDVQVAECPNSCGKVKSPMCCGHDMQATG